MSENGNPVSSGKKRRLKDRLILLLIGFIGIALSFLAFYAEIRSEEVEAKRDFEEAVNRKRTFLKKSFEGVESALGSLSDFYLAFSCGGNFVSQG